MSNYFNEGIKTLQKWVKINSEKGKCCKNMPFGKGVNKMLKLALKDGKKLGFEAINYSNYAGEVVWGEGEDKEGLAILCHLDVVPCGNKKLWKYPPFSGKIVNGVMYGRGVVDDKGATALCLYALKELKDSGIIPKRKVKLIFGLDEETGNESLDFYKKVAVMPTEGFAPDGHFPVIYAEKGIIHAKYTFKKGKNLLIVKGGTKVNVVCDNVEISLNEINEEIIKKVAEFGGETQENGKITFKGVSSHGSTPHLGDNAILKALKFLYAINEFEKEDFENFVEDRFKIKDLKDETGELTFSPDLISCDEENIFITTDIRYPSTKKGKEIIEILDKIGKNEIISHTKPLMVSKDSKLVKTLCNTYNKVMKTNEEPVSMGGGTYAKQLEKGVAFGPTPDKVSKAHIINESEEITYLEKCYEIYKLAIKELISE